MRGLSEREKLLLDTLLEFGTVKDAAYHLQYHKKVNLSIDACYAILWRLRRRYQKARAFINAILVYRQKSPLLKKVLTPKVALNHDDGWSPELKLLEDGEPDEATYRA